MPAAVSDSGCGFYFTNYLEKEILQERTSQLVEVISRGQTNLNTTLDFLWNFFTATVNALEAGMNAHVVEPVDMAVLEETVKAVTES